jgi:hypothetical protein
MRSNKVYYLRRVEAILFFLVIHTVLSQNLGNSEFETQKVSIINSYFH